MALMYQAVRVVVEEAVEEDGVGGAGVVEAVAAVVIALHVLRSRMARMSMERRLRLMAAVACRYQHQCLLIAACSCYMLTFNIYFWCNSWSGVCLSVQAANMHFLRLESL